MPRCFKRIQRLHRHGQAKALPALPVTPCPCVKGRSAVGGRKSSFKQLLLFLLWLFAEMHIRTSLISTHPQVFSFWLPIHSKGGSIGHRTLTTSILFTHPPNKNHKKVPVVKNITNIINLYLERPLRVFPLTRTWKRQCSLSALCKCPCRLLPKPGGGVSWPESHVFLRSSLLTRSPCRGPRLPVLVW